jgi:hypothetical protein
MYIYIYMCVYYDPRLAYMHHHSSTTPAPPGAQLSVGLVEYDDPFWMNRNEHGEINAVNPGVFVEMMDELASRAGFTWRDTYGIILPPRWASNHLRAMHPAISNASLDVEQFGGWWCGAWSFVCPSNHALFSSFLASLLFFLFSPHPLPSSPIESVMLETSEDLQIGLGRTCFCGV